MGRKGPSSGRRGPAKEKRDPELFSESDDEQIIDDAFAQGKGKVKLGGGGEDSDEIDEEAVYDLSDSDEESGSDEGDEEDEDDGEPDLDEEIERGGRAGRRERCSRRDCFRAPAATADAIAACTDSFPRSLQPRQHMHTCCRACVALLVACRHQPPGPALALQTPAYLESRAPVLYVNPQWPSRPSIWRSA
jgi:hypothetical protein